MKWTFTRRACLGTLGLLLGLVVGCQSTDRGGSVNGTAYYGLGAFDPWYYGGEWDDPDLIVTPPDREDWVRPSPPIANVPPPRPTPLPTIPARVRPAPRR